MKKYKKWILPLLTVFAIFGMTFASAMDKKPMTYVKNVKDYEEVMAMDEAYLYFGRDSCHYCQAFQPLLFEAIEETGSEVHYYDTDAHSGEAGFQDILDEHEVVTVPKLVKLKKGEIVDYVDHTHKQSHITALLAR